MTKANHNDPEKLKTADNSPQKYFWFRWSFWWKFMAFIIVFGGLGTLITYPIFQRQIVNHQRALCQANLRRISQAIQMYSKDYDDKYPPYFISNSFTASPLHAYGWADAVEPYIGNSTVFKCPISGSSGDWPSSKGYTDYWLNPMLSAFQRHNIHHPENVILIGEGFDGTSRYSFDGCNAPNDKTAIPKGKYTSSCTSAGKVVYSKNNRDLTTRHIIGGNYIFVDGSVRWLNTGSDIEMYNSVTPQSQSKYTPTFNPG